MNAHKYLVNAHKEYYNTQQLETQRNCKYTNIIMKLKKKALLYIIINAN